MEYEFVFIVEGVLHLSIDGVAFDLKKGDCAFVPGGAIHGGTPENCVYECLVLDILQFLDNNTVCRKQLQELLDNDNLIINVFPSGSNVNSITKEMFRAFENESDGYELTVKGLLFQLLGEIIKCRLFKTGFAAKTSETRHTEQLKNALRYIRENYRSQITLQDLANTADMVPKYFCRFFKQMSGRTPIDYLNYYRIEIACEELAATGAPITEIALDCGFNDLSYFIKIFKRFKGISPKQYQKAYSSAKNSDRKY